MRRYEECGTVEIQNSEMRRYERCGTVEVQRFKGAEVQMLLKSIKSVLTLCLIVYICNVYVMFIL